MLLGAVRSCGAGRAVRQGDGRLDLLLLLLHFCCIFICYHVQELQIGGQISTHTTDVQAQSELSGMHLTATCGHTCKRQGEQALAAPRSPVTTTWGWMRVPPQCCSSKLTVSSSRAARPTAHMKGYLAREGAGPGARRAGESGGPGGDGEACSSTSTQTFNPCMYTSSTCFSSKQQYKDAKDKAELAGMMRRGNHCGSTCTATAAPHLPGGAGLPLLISSRLSACNKRPWRALVPVLASAIAAGRRAASRPTFKASREAVRASKHMVESSSR